jgi:hypothetical protein
VRFDSLKFNWLGSLHRLDGMCIAWHVLNRLFGTRFKVVSGYKDGTDVYLAMERGEVEGRCGGQLTVIKSTRPQWLTEHKINVPIVIRADGGKAQAASQPVLCRLFAAV